MIFNRVIDELNEKRIRRHEGKLNAIPFSLERFNTVIPGIEQGKTYIVTASSKVGKTQLCDFLFVYNVIKFLNEDKGKSGISAKIFYFSLEMAKEEKMKQLISYFLYIKKGLLLSPTKLESKYKNYILDEEILKFLKEEKEFFELFENVVTFYDEIKNPFGIYKEIRDYADNNGLYYDKEGKVIPMPDIKLNNKGINLTIDHYKKNNPEEYVIIIIDHISLITPEKGLTKHESMSKLSSEYLLRARDRWGYTPVIVQQQSADGEKQQFTIKGESIINKIKPSPDNLADNKLIGRDCNYMLGLFAPNRYGFEKYNNYDLTRLKDAHRDLSIIFSRHSTGSQSVGLLFLGAVNFFEELPKEMSEKDYKQVEEILKKQKDN